MPSSDPVQRFQDILDNIARIERFTAGLNLQTFSDNEQTLFAVQYALLIISEAAAKLGRLAADICPGLPWADLRGLGNRLRHEYHTIDVARLWLMIERDLAENGRRRGTARASEESGCTAVKIGYAHVSTEEQNLDLQKQALKAAGCKLVIGIKAYPGP